MLAWVDAWDFLALLMTVTSLVFMFIGQKYAESEEARMEVFKKSIGPACCGIGYVIIHWYVMTH